MSGNKIYKTIISIDWFWVSIAAMAIAMMHYDYSCDGNSCKAPVSECQDKELK